MYIKTYKDKKNIYFIAYYKNIFYFRKYTINHILISIMKKIAFFVCALITSLSAQAQSEVYKKMFQVSGVVSFYYSKDQIESAKLEDIDNPDVNLTNLNMYRIQSLEYLSATKRRAIRKLRKAQDESIKNNSNGNASEPQIIMQVNKNDRNQTIYQKNKNSYLLITDNKDRYTVIRMVANVPSFYMDQILVK